MQGKRARLDDPVSPPMTPSSPPPSWTLSPVLDAELTRAEVPSVDAWVAVVADRRQASRLIRELAARSPVAQLLHLKRCAGDRIILALATASADDCVDKLLADGVDLAGLQVAVASLDDDSVVNAARSSEAGATAADEVNARGRSGEDSGGDAVAEVNACVRHRLLVHRRPVPALKPRSRRQYDAALRLWPSNFHEDRRLERLLAGTEFSAAQLAALGVVMARCVAAARGVGVAAAVIDPRTGAVLVECRDGRREHPLRHAVMEAVDAVARMQGGGAWRSDTDDAVVHGVVGVGEPLASVLAHRKRGRPRDAVNDGDSDEDGDESAVSRETGSADNEKFTEQAGVDKMVIEQDIDDRVKETEQEGAFVAEKPSSGKTGPKTGPYLCTGYDVVVTREPCAMCAMALVHARARRVFFGCAAPGGALRSRAQLHLMRSLNHNYEAFGGLMERQCRRVWDDRET